MFRAGDKTLHLPTLYNFQNLKTKAESFVKAATYIYFKPLFALE